MIAETVTITFNTAWVWILGAILLVILIIYFGRRLF